MFQPEVLNTLYSLFTLSLLGMSAAVWAQIWKRKRSGQPLLVKRFRRGNVPLPPFAVGVMIVYLLGFVVLPQAVMLLKPDAFGQQSTGDLSRDQVRNVLMVTVNEGLIAIPIFLGAVLLGSRSRVEMARLGFRTDRPGQQIWEGVLGFLAAALPVALLLVATLPLRGTDVEHPLLKMLKVWGVGQEMVLIFLAAGVLAPLKEELLFRVMLQTWLLQWMSPAWAIGLCAVIFSAVHGYPDAIPLLPLALVLGVVFHYRRSYLTVVVIHVLFNLYNLVATLIPPVEELP